MDDQLEQPAGYGLEGRNFDFLHGYHKAMLQVAQFANDERKAAVVHTTQDRASFWVRLLGGKRQDDDLKWQDFDRASNAEWRAFDRVLSFAFARGDAASKIRMRAK